jgi:hypothetical protein
MSSYLYYTLFFIHIDPQNIHLNLLDEGAREYGQRFIHREVFSFDTLPRNSGPNTQPPRRFRSFFQTLTKAKSIALETDILPYEVYMEECNNACTARIIDHTNKEDLADISFPKHDWANIEEHLLTHGLLLTALTEWKEKRYTIPRLQSSYELVYRPDCDPYLRVTSPHKERLPEIVAHAGVYMAHALDISEEELFQKLNTDTHYNIFE